MAFVKTLMDTVAMDDADLPPAGGSTSSGGAQPTQMEYLEMLRKAGGDPAKLAMLVQEWHAARANQANAGAIGDIFKSLPPNLQQNGVQADATHWVDPTTGTVWEYRPDDKGAPNWSQLSDGDSKRYLGSIGGIPTGPTGTSTGSTQRLAGDDPRYWANLDRQFQLDVDTLAAQLQNNGLDAESARRQALTTLIANRNNTAVDVANTSANVAKTAAEFAANPRDAVAELMYRNQVGGSTPFGDMTSKNFGEYGKTLAEKAASIFQPVAQDLNQARQYRDSIPATEFYGPEIRQQLGLQPTSAQALAGGGGSSSTSLPVSSAAPAFDPIATLQAARAGAGNDYTFLQGLAQLAGKPADFTGATSPDPGVTGVRRFAEGGQLNFDDIYDNRNKPGDAPTSTEGGLNVNLNERAVVVTESGKIIATLGERRPDGTVRGEQLIVKPLKSEVDKDRKLEEANKAKVETQKKTLAAFAGGGTLNATPDDFMQQLSKMLGGYGGAGGGAGPYSTPLPSLRLLAGAPANALADDPVANDYAMAGYSALGIDPRTVQSTINKFTPKSAQLNAQTGIRTSFI